MGKFIKHHTESKHLIVYEVDGISTKQKNIISSNSKTIFSVALLMYNLAKIISILKLNVDFYHFWHMYIVI